MVTQRKIIQMAAYVAQDFQHLGPVRLRKRVLFLDASGYVERSRGFKNKTSKGPRERAQTVEKWRGSSSNPP